MKHVEKDNSLPLVSVLIPTYNRPHYVTLAVQSVLRQTYPNIEIIITDDSTNDATKEALVPFVNSCHNLTYIKNDHNLGGEKNFQKVYSLSKGEYVNYLMDDDLFLPEKIKRMMEYFLQDKFGTIKLVTSHRRAIDEYGRELSDSKYTEPRAAQEVIMNGWIAGNSIISEFNWIGEPTTVLFRKKDLIEPFGTFCGRQYRSGVDVASWLVLLAQGNMAYIPDTLSYGRYHESNLSKSEDTRLRAIMDWIHLIFHSYKKGFLRSTVDRKGAIESCIHHIQMIKPTVGEKGKQELAFYAHLVKQQAAEMEEKEASYMKKYYRFKTNTAKPLPLVSVLIPTYNRPHYVQLALESVLHQTYPNIEIIIGDDSTNNDTKEVLKPYLHCYPFITYYKNEQNIGGELNFQKVYEYSKGEYINYLMDDDLFHPQKIEWMMEYYLDDTDENYKLVTSFRPIIDGEGEIIPEGLYQRYPHDLVINGLEAGDSLVEEFNWIGEPTTVLFRRKDLIEPYGSFAGRQYYNSVDVASWLTLLAQGDMVYIKDPLSFTRSHDNQVGNRQSLRVSTTTDWVHVLFHGEKKGFLKDVGKKRRSIALCMSHIHHVMVHYPLTSAQVQEMMFYKACLQQYLHTLQE